MKILKRILSLLTCVILCAAFTSTLQSQSSLFSKEQFTKDGESLQYRKLISDYNTESTYPLVIFLHGSGERGADNEAQLKWGVQNFATGRVMKVHKPIVIAPQCPEGMRWGNYAGDNLKLQEAPTQPMKLLVELISETISKMPVDPTRIYITGLSMGGYGTFDILARHSDLFAAALPICGAGDVSKANSFSHVPMWIVHGALDSVVKPSHTMEMYDSLLKAGANPGLTIYPDVGHFSWIAAYDDENIIDWLFKQKNKKLLDLKNKK